MGQRIRHLEYYGYNDQNVYIGLPNVDLSDIRETNRQQDKDIKDKADISMVQEVSGELDKFINAQSRINKKVIGAIKVSFDNIDNLKKRDKQITDKINEIGDKFDPIYDKLGSMSDDISSLEEKVSEHLSNSADSMEKLDEIEALVSEKLGKSEADELYAKKENTYSKNDVDKAISDSVNGLASQEWVYSKKYISEDDADTKYASKARLNALEDRVTDTQTKLYNQYNELNTALVNFKNDANNRIDTVYGRVDTLEKKHEREVTSLQDKAADLQDQINANKAAIKEINDVSLSNKVDKSTFNDLSSKVSDIAKEMTTKVDNSVYDKDKSIFGNSLDKLDDKKADKTALDEVKRSVDELDVKLSLEEEARKREDSTLKDYIDELKGRVNGIVEDNLDRDAALSSIESKIEKETADRQNADEKIVGSENDKADAATIYGVRKYADLVASSAVKKANDYATSLAEELRGYVNDADDALRVEMSGKANKAYVDAIRNEIQDSVSSRLLEETERAKDKEDKISSALDLETVERLNGDSKLANSLDATTNIVKAITDWDGNDRNNYTDVGNGILDVLHREFQELAKRVSELEKKLS